jgi:hypothetical protein
MVETSRTIPHSGLDPWFDRLTTLSNVEVESSFFKSLHSWMPDQVRHDGDVDFNQPILIPLVL